MEHSALSYISELGLLGGGGCLAVDELPGIHHNVKVDIFNAIGFQ